MSKHSDLEGVGFIIAHHFLVCVRPDHIRLANTDFVAHILNFDLTIQFRMISS